MSSNRHFGHESGFIQVGHVVYRLYPLLDGFDITTAGLYSYLHSWRNTKEGYELYHCVWQNKDYMYRQSGLSRYKFNKHLKLLIEYGLIDERNSSKVPNKKIYEVLEPLSADVFMQKYSAEVQKFLDDIAVLNEANEQDRKSRQEKGIVPKVSELSTEEIIELL
jgi:hypothetical protein